MRVSTQNPNPIVTLKVEIDNENENQNESIWNQKRIVAQFLETHGA